MSGRSSGQQHTCLHVLCSCTATMISAAVQGASGCLIFCLLSTTCTICRERLQALKGELAKEEDKAKQQSAAQLKSITAEAGRLEAAARQEGEARCSTVQVWRPGTDIESPIWWPGKG